MAGRLDPLFAPRAGAQAPNLRWLTIETQHFYVHFNPATEPLARRLAADAERAYAELARELHPPRGKIDVVGLMCIPPADDPPAPHFALLKKLARRNGLGGLSMGMSGDYETAAEIGATHVRVGSAIFGARG